MKCPRCGKIVETGCEICPSCGYNFLMEKKDAKAAQASPEIQDSTDSFDYPVLTFVFSLLGMVIPVFVFSVLALVVAKKEARAGMVPFQKVGKVLGYLGIVASTILFTFLIIFFLG